MGSKDGDAYMKEGKKMMSTSLFKWKPDYDGAAAAYDQAGNMYKVSRKFDQAIEAFKQAADAHYKAANFYNAAKACEMAGNLLRDQKRSPAEICRAFKKASEIFMEDGKPERASEVLTKAIRLLEKELSARPNEDLKTEIISLYKDAIDVVDDKHHVVGETMRQFNSFLVKEGEYGECVANMQKLIAGYDGMKQPHNVWKSYLSVIVLYLKMDDWVAADDAQQSFVQKHPEYQSTDEYDLAQQLLDAFQQNNEQLLQQALKSNKFKFLESQIHRVASKLSLTGVANVSTTSKRRLESDAKRTALFGANDEEQEGDEQSEEGAEEYEETRSTADGEERHQPREQAHVEEQLDAFDPYNLT